MKKIITTAVIALMLSAGLASKTQAQTAGVNTEILSTAISNVKPQTQISETPFYNKAGKLIYTVKRYDASALSKNIRRMVTNQYSDFDIVGVEEIETAATNNSIYFVHIADDKKLKTIRVVNGESEVVNEYTKG